MPKNIDNEHTDAELVQLAVRGDQGAFGQLYDRYAPLVRARSYDKMGNPEDAQELCQEVFLRAFTKLTTLQEASKFLSWRIASDQHCRTAAWGQAFALVVSVVEGGLKWWLPG